MGAAPVCMARPRHTAARPVAHQAPLVCTTPTDGCRADEWLTMHMTRGLSRGDDPTGEA